VGKRSAAHGIRAKTHADPEGQRRELNDFLRFSEQGNVKFPQLTPWAAKGGDAAARLMTRS